MTTKDERHSTLMRRLSDAGIRPSAQRLAILDYISTCKCHPTADEVYSSLVKDYPTLSRTTVFSSLRLLAEKGLLNDIDIAAESTRYDPVIYEPHAHFMCRKCRRIFDIPFDLSSVHAPEYFKCDNINVFFKGICPDCSNNKTYN